jgi:hypothetical protein
MPNELDNKQGGTGDDAAAKVAADKAAADAAAAAAAGAGSGNGAGAGDGEETVTMKKSELKKIEDDRDNYKTGLLAKKADERNLHEAGAGAGAGQGAGDGKSGVVVDEKKISETAAAATNKVMRDAAERTAKRSFLKAHPEYVDDAQWTAMMAHLTFKGSELTHDEVLDRMEAAVLEHKRSTGKLDEYMREERERGVREGRIQAEVGSGHGTGAAGDKNEGGKGAGTLSPKGEEMARAMHTDIEKVKKVDPSKDNVINVV